MRRILSTIFLVTVITAVKAQSLPDIERRLSFINTPSSVAEKDTTGFSKLPKLMDFDCDDHFKAYDVPENKTKWDYYNVVDLNGDALKDLIYSGPCLPYFQTSIFLHNGSTLTKVLELAGEMISIQTQSGGTSITLFKEAIGADCNNTLVEVLIRRNSKVEERSISFDSNTELKLGRLEKVLVRGVLRSTPELDDEKKLNYCAGDSLTTGNQIMKIKRSTEVTQLNKQGKWLLILFPETKTQSWIGWINPDK